MGAELLRRSDLEDIEVVDDVVTAERAGTEAVACSGLAAGDTVMGEGLGMVAEARMGRGAGADADAGLLAE
jgi:hypothetical protein